MSTSSGQPMDESYAREAAAAIAGRLGGIDGVVGVALGGSLARGSADAHSDADIGIYYRAERPPSVRALDSLAEELDDRHRPGLVTEYGEWGPWVNGGAWLEIGGRRVDWLYRDLGKVRAAIDDCRAGRVTCDYQAGHPHGFHNHIYMAEAHLNVPLHDPESVLGEIRALTAPYPEPMRSALVDRYLWEASFALDVATKPAERGDEFHLLGSLFRSVACLVQVLFAVNREYFVNEKGAVAAIERFGQRPERFASSVHRILEPSADAAPRQRLAVARALIEEVRPLVYPSSA